MPDRDGDRRRSPDTVYASAGAPADEAWLGGAASRDDAAPRAAASRPAPRAAPSPGRVPPGTHLNDTYEVGLRLSRGGMGEVYEGHELQTGDRVAIKVILDHLAEDPMVESMLRAEARALARLKSDALVKYRVLGRDRTLNVLYLVMDFVEGRTLDDLIGEIHPSQRAFKALMRRLAEGLTAAHAQGIYHRDISPDNILLPGGRLESATIIDFGIAKDTQTVQATIIGAGFAGKLNYVAPEQLGDYERHIGPWTDIYSLGLVLLCVAAGDIVDMGMTLADAVDRRRAMPDLSPLPPSLQPVFARMLAPRPADRFQSMDELLGALGQIPDYPTLPPTQMLAPPTPREPPRQAPSPPPPPDLPRPISVAPISTPPRAPPAPSPVRPGARKRAAEEAAARQRLLIAGGATLAVLALGLIVMLVALGWHGPATNALAAANAGSATDAAAPGSETAVLDDAIRSQSCAWISYDASSSPPTALTGVAHDRDVSDIQSKLKSHDFAPIANQEGVGDAPTVDCAKLALLAPHAEPGAAWVTGVTTPVTPQGGCPNQPTAALEAVDVDMTGAPDAAVWVLSPDGQLAALRSDQIKTVNGRGSVNLCEAQTGLYGLAVVHGQGPLDPSNLAGAAASGWRIQMAWFEVGSAAPGATPVASATPAPPTQTPPASPPARGAGPSNGGHAHSHGNGHGHGADDPLNRIPMIPRDN